MQSKLSYLLNNSKKLLLLTLCAGSLHAEEGPQIDQCPRHRNLSDAEKPYYSDSLQLDADTLSSESKDKLRLQGRVSITFRDQKLEAESAVVDNASDEISAAGNIRFRSADIHFSGDSIQANMSKNSLTIENAEYESYTNHFSGSAEKIALEGEEGKLSLDGARLSSCPRDDQTWYLSASNITLHEKSGWGEAEDMALYVKDVPIFYFPAFSFPISEARKTGFLYPNIRNATHTGLDFSIPYYLNLAPNYDATFQPRLMSESGFQLSSEFRFLTSYVEGKVVAEFLAEDNNLNLQGQSDKRYLGHLYATNPIKGPINYEIDYTRLSDDNYLRDLGGFAANQGDYIQQRATLNYQQDDWEMALIFNSDDALNTPLSPYERLPQITLNYAPLARDFRLNWQLFAEYSHFDSSNAITGSRTHIEPELSFPMNWEAGYIRPSLRYPTTYYHQSGLGVEDKSIYRTLPMMSVDTALYFEKYFSWREKLWLQTVKPRLFFLYTPNETQDSINLFDTALLDRGYEQLFRSNRFIGFDRIGDSKQITIALETNFLDTTRNFQTLNARLGRAYFLNRQLVNVVPTTTKAGPDDRHSPYIMDLSYHINRHWYMNTGMEWEPSPATTQRSYFRLNYIAEQNRVFNITHRLSRNTNQTNVEQLDLSVAWPVRDNWHFVGRWSNDLTSARTLETFAGLEYRDCCWSVRLVGRRYIDVELDDNGIPISTGNEFSKDILLEFVFNGFTSIGESSLGRFLETSIYGYRDQLGP